MTEGIRKLRLTVDLIMTTLWGFAALVRLLVLLPARDWLGLGGVAICSFIAVAFAIDFKRTRTANASGATPKWMQFIAILALVLAIIGIGGGVILGSLGIDIHWRGFR